jgi:hypothetical protein
LGRKLGVPNGVLDVLVPEVVLQGARVLAIIGEFETTGMAEHVRVAAQGAKLTVRESAAGTTPQDGADRQGAVVLASTQRDELGIDD